jgi:two-component system KDP operon response regulator KdpE
MVCQQVSPEILAYSQPHYLVEHLASPKEAFKRLYNTQYHIIIVEVAIFGQDWKIAIDELKRCYPLNTLLALADPRYTDLELLGMGLDGVVPQQLHEQGWHFLIRSFFQQQQQKLALHQRSKMLHRVSQIVNDLYFADDVRDLVQVSINALCRHFGLDGVAILIQEEPYKHLYAGCESKELYASPVLLETYHPFQRSLDMGLCQIHEDICQDAYYQPIPKLQHVRACIIVPLRYKDATLGTLAVFSSTSNFLDDDLVVYEIFASHFSAALTQIRHHSLQQNDFEFNQRLLEAWQSFSSFYNLEELAEAVHSFLTRIGGVGQALVWLYDNAKGQIVVRSNQAGAAEAFLKLEENHQVSQLLRDLDDHHYLALRRQVGPGRQIAPLLERMGTSEYMLFGIVRANTFIGGVLLATMPTTPFRMVEYNLVYSICQITAQKYESIILFNDINVKSTRLEALLLNVNEGTFFVDNKGSVTFCSAQFAEQTGIQPHEVVGLPYQDLVRRLAQRCKQGEYVERAILSVVEKLGHPYPSEDDHAIVELILMERSFDLEFSPLIGTNGSLGWGGFLRHRAEAESAEHSEGLARLMQQHFQGLMHQLSQNLQDLTLNRPSQMQPAWFNRVRDVAINLQLADGLWDNFSYIANGELNEEEGQELQAVVQQVQGIDLIYRQRLKPSLSDAHAGFILTHAAQIAALRGLLIYCGKYAQQVIQISALQEDDDLLLIFDPISLHSTNPALLKLLNGESDDLHPLEDDMAAFNLYLCGQLLRRHQGQMTIEAYAVNKLRLLVRIPILPTTETLAERGSSSPLRRILFIEGKSELGRHIYSSLRKSSFHITSVQTLAQVTAELKQTNFDLLAVDARWNEGEASKVMETLKRYTEAPVLLFANDAPQAERTRAFQAGAAEFVTQENSLEEISSRIGLVLNRQLASDRQRPPLEWRYLKIDFARRQVFFKGRPVRFTPTEYKLLRMLAINADKVISHQDLLREIWGADYQNEKQYLWVNLSRVRKKIEPDPDGPLYIHNESGVGYRFSEQLPDSSDDPDEDQPHDSRNGAHPSGEDDD